MTVYLTMQKPVKTSGEYNKSITTQLCGKEPFEIALRFAGCNLKCGACFAGGYSWSPKYEKHYRVRSDVPIDSIVQDFLEIEKPLIKDCYNWLRILGGEPILNDEYIEYLFRILMRIVELDKSLFNKGIIIQTNGIHNGKGYTGLLKTKLEALNNLAPDVKVVIEVSIKGTNPKEFSLITRSNQELFKHNIQAYYNLVDLDVPNLRPVVIAGYGISESYLLNEGKNPLTKISLLFNKNTPTYHPSISMSTTTGEE